MHTSFNVIAFFIKLIICLLKIISRIMKENLNNLKDVYIELIKALSKLIKSNNLEIGEKSLSYLKQFLEFLVQSTHLEN